MNFDAINSNNNILILGAGPAGIALATVLKTINNQVNVTVLDKRAETGRSYGLAISSDSIDAIHSLLNKHLAKNHANPHEIKSLISFFKTWKNTVRPTKEIESELAQRATAIGVNVIRKDQYKEAITEQGFDQLLNAHLDENTLTPVQRELRPYFQNAKVIVGADGRHSRVRQKFVTTGDAEKRVDVENMEYFIELKCRTLQTTDKRMSYETVKASSCEGVAFETMSRKKNGSEDNTKPLTMHFFVGKTTYDAFNNATDQNPWDLTRLQEMSIDNPIVANQAAKIVHYLKGVLDRGGCCIDPKIKKLPIEIYRSTEVIKVVDKRIIARLGDAFSGAVFARGVNKAFLEATHLAEAISEFVDHDQKIEVEIPEPFKRYESIANQIFENERWWAKFKANSLKGLRLSLRYIMKPIRYISQPLVIPYNIVKSYFYKEPTLGELVQLLEQRNREVKIINQNCG